MSSFAFCCLIEKHGELVHRGNGGRLESEEPEVTEDQRWDIWDISHWLVYIWFNYAVRANSTLFFDVQGQKGDTGQVGLPGWPGLIVSQIISSLNIHSSVCLFLCYKKALQLPVFALPLPVCFKDL